MTNAPKINFFLADAARMRDRLSKAKRLCPTHTCLYNGKGEQIFQKIGPYIFQLQNYPAFVDWIVAEGFGDAWGIFLYSPATMSQLQIHFQKFKIVRENEGIQKYFRYYDPRVLGTVLPQYNSRQLADFFGPVMYFIAEGLTKDRALQFTVDKSTLLTTPMDSVELFGRATLESKS